MRLGDVALSQIAARLAGPGLALDFGLARARVRTPVADLAPPIQLLYADFPLIEPDGFFDVTASIRPVPGVRRWVRPQVSFMLDGKEPFEPFPSDTHVPLLEWGLNWAIANRSNHALLLHAGVVERGGKAVLLPALPGSGKSTLTAALSMRGYRLLSDEFGAVRLGDGMVSPALRPVALKNESIEVMRDFAPHATIGPVFPRTRKGRVAHLAPDAHSVAQRHSPAMPALIVFPRFRAGSDTVLEPMAKAEAFTKLAANSFNYEILGPEAFEAMAQLIERCQAFRLAYSSLDEAIRTVSDLLAAA
jgi:HprK-related kinase A